MTSLDYMAEKEVAKNVDSVLHCSPYPNTKQYLFRTFSLWQVKIREFEWEISFGLMKSGVCREMVIAL